MKNISVITLSFLINQLIDISASAAIEKRAICSDSSETPDCTPGIVKTIFGQPISEKCAPTGGEDTLYNCPVLYSIYLNKIIQ
jgi:hypothetical protein